MYVLTCSIWQLKQISLLPSSHTTCICSAAAREFNAPHKILSMWYRCFLEIFMNIFLLSHTDWVVWNKLLPHHHSYSRSSDTDPQALSLQVIHLTVELPRSEPLLHREGNLTHIFLNIFLDPSITELESCKLFHLNYSNLVTTHSTEAFFKSASTFVCCVHLTLAGHQVPTKVVLSITSLARQGRG